jgi:low affinity Fe/Cu permease
MISFSNTLYGIALKHAQRKGITLQEYIRYLIVKDDEKEEPVYMVDEETEQRIAESMDDYKNGRYTRVTNDKELEDYFDSLDKD